MLQIALNGEAKWPRVSNKRELTLSDYIISRMHACTPCRSSQGTCVRAIFILGSSEALLHIMSRLLSLPVEVFDIILGFVRREDLLKLRMVSKHFNAPCQRLVWKRVVITPTGEWPFSFDDLGFADPRLERYDRNDLPVTLSYQQVAKLGDEPEFEEAVKNTKEIYIRYDPPENTPWALFQYNVSFDTICELFGQVTTVRVMFSGRLDHSYAMSAFPYLLEQWKPIADFCLELDVMLSYENFSCIDTEDMHIREIIIEQSELVPHQRPMLPLSRTEDGVPIRLTDLHTVSNHLHTLSIYPGCNIFIWNWIPDCIKCLRLSNHFGCFSGAKKLVVPQSVESLHVADFYDLETDVDDDRYTVDTVTILSCVDLRRARGLKELYFQSMDISGKLAQAIRHVRGSLEHLSIHCSDVTSYSSFDFGSLAQSGLGLKRLQLSLGAVHTEISGYHFPELEWLTLSFDNPLKMTDQLNFVDELVAGFLRGCPKLRYVQWEASYVHSMKWWPKWVSQKPWIGSGDASGMVDIPKAKAVLLK